jgi:glutathione S-transferase
MKLIGSLASPYVRKVRVVLAEKKIEYKFELDDVWSAQSKVHSSNPLGKVPCLVMEDGGAMFDSRVIVEYLDSVSPVNRLIPANSRARAEVKTWEALGDGLLDAAILARVEVQQRALEQRSQSWIDRQMGKVNAALASVSSGLGNKPWACEGKYSLADIAIGCTLGWLEFRMPQLDWRFQYPNLSRHLDKLNTRPAFASTRPA